MRWPALVGPTLRATRRGALLGAMAVGLAIVAVPAAVDVTLAPDNLAVVLRLGVACAAIGVPFLFDDPAKPTTATTPTPSWRSTAIRATAAVVAVALWWTAAVTITLAGAQDGAGDPLPLADLTLEAATVVAIALAAAVFTWRHVPRGIVSPAAAPAVLVVVAMLAFAPRRLTLFPEIGTTAWHDAHQRWTVLLAASITVGLLATALPPTRRRPSTPTTGHPPTALRNPVSDDRTT